MTKSEEIRLLKERLDYYTMEAEDDQFDAEEVIRLLEVFWEYVKEREREEKIIAGR